MRRGAKKRKRDYWLPSILIRRIVKRMNRKKREPQIVNEARGKKKKKGQKASLGEETGTIFIGFLPY